MEAKYRTRLPRHVGEVALAELRATQSEIELIKYKLVRYEGYRLSEPIVVYRGRLATPYVIDGHTRARVLWDTGSKAISCIVFTCSDVEVDLEVGRMALQAGKGREMRMWEIPIADRIGEGTPAWEERRRELLRQAQAEGQPKPASRKRRPSPAE
jgi:hypothetical protein